MANIQYMIPANRSECEMILEAFADICKHPNLFPYEHGSVAALCLRIMTLLEKPPGECV